MSSQLLEVILFILVPLCVPSRSDRNGGKGLSNHGYIGRRIARQGVSVNVVLVVEDDPDILEITAYMLEDAGYEVITANGSAHALTAAAGRRDITLVLTDLNLRNDITGIEMGLLMRSNGLSCPLIVTSGDNEPPMATLEPWMTYLSKPFDRETLLATIASRLEPA
jgi:DNA-binding NtrC family response regulator